MVKLRPSTVRRLPTDWRPRPGSPPELVADDDHVGAGALFFLAKAAAQSNGSTPSVEKRFAETTAPGTCRDGPRPVTVKLAVWCAAIDTSVFVSRRQSKKSGHDADSRARHGAAQIGFVDGHQLMGRGERQRPQHHGAHHAEHRRVGADAEAEGQDGGDGERGAFHNARRA